MSAEPVSVRFEPGQMVSNYRLPGGCIVSIVTPQPRIDLEDLIAEIGLTAGDLDELITTEECL